MTDICTVFFSLLKSLITVAGDNVILLYMQHARSLAKSDIRCANFQTEFHTQLLSRNGKSQSLTVIVFSMLTISLCLGFLDTGCSSDI